MPDGTFRKGVFRLGGLALTSRPLRPIASRFFSARANVIFYHAAWRRDDPRTRLFGGIEVDRLRDDMGRLARVFRFVSLADLLAEQAAPAPAGERRPSLAVTFDDGFELVHTGAAEIMRSMGVRATVFVNSTSARYDRLMWQHRFALIRALRGDEAFVAAMAAVQRRIGSGVPMRSAADKIRVTRSWPVDDKEGLTDEVWAACGMPPMEGLLDEHRPYMDFATLREWIGMGHAVGFHTRSHPFCSLLDAAQMRRELVEPVEELKRELGLASVPFAYPFGDRLRPELERELAAANPFSCLLGTAGSSRRGTSPEALDRIETEEGVDSELFGKPILRGMRRALRPGRAV